MKIDMKSKIIQIIKKTKTKDKTRTDSFITKEKHTYIEIETDQQIEKM